MHKDSLLSHESRVAGLFHCGIAADMKISVVVPNECAPRASGKLLDSLDAAYRVLSALRIQTVLNTVSDSDIGDSVICPDPIDVIEKSRPLTVDVEPRKPMCIELLSIDGNADVASLHQCSSDDSGLYLAVAASASDIPFEFASLWVVFQKFAQTLRSKIGLSHDALQLLIGQRPAAIRSRARASSFYAAVA